jgi:hypothetical protein
MNCHLHRLVDDSEQLPVNSGTWGEASVSSGAIEMRASFARVCLATGLTVAFGALSVDVASAIQTRVVKCVCLSGYQARGADAQDYVCVSDEDAGLTDKQNRHAAINRISSTDITCKPGWVWRDAFDGDAVCVNPVNRDKVHYQNAHWGAYVDGLNSGNSACRYAPQ